MDTLLCVTPTRCPPPGSGAFHALARGFTWRNDGERTGVAIPAGQASSGLMASILRVASRPFWSTPVASVVLAERAIRPRASDQFQACGPSLNHGHGRAWGTNVGAEL